MNLTHRTNISNVCDFCVGDGELLRSAEKKWPEANIFGVDISKEVVYSTIENHPNWTLTCHDFLLADYHETFDIVLLNPPFSCKGSKINITVFENQTFKVSTAMLFLLKSITHLNETGTLYAILPSSIAFSQKDKEAWNYLQEHKYAKIIDYIEGKVFKGCMPNIIIVSINDLDTKEFNNEKFVPQKKYRKTVKSIKRGQITPKFVTKSDLKGHYLIHTTNLANNSIFYLRYIIDTQNSLIEGPAILLPRVGRPNPLKIAIVLENETYAISDCIIGIQTYSNDQSIELFEWINKNWKEFLKLYNGTGAKYLTISELKKVIPSTT